MENTNFKPINSQHKITPSEYQKYLQNFWGIETPIQLTLDQSEFQSLLRMGNNDSYVQFTFNDKKSANDINYNLVRHHSFNSFSSCVSKILLDQFFNDLDYSSLKVVKGIKNIVRNINNPYEGDYYIMMLIYQDTLGNVQYYDILEDPTKPPVS